MPAGIQILNTTGSVQVDETYSNFYLTAKGSVTIADITIASGASTRGAMVTVNGSSPLLAWRGAPATVQYVSRIGNSWTYTLLSSAANGTAVHWYAFDSCENYAPSVGHGLQVFRADGKLAFDSTALFLRPKQLITRSVLGGSYGGMPGAAQTYSFPAGRTMSAVNLQPGASASGTYEITHATAFANPQSNQITMTDGFYAGPVIAEGPQPWANAYLQPGRFLAVDVTGY